MEIFIALIVGLILGNLYAKLNVVLTEYGLNEMFNRAKEKRRERKEESKGVAE